MQNMEKMSLVPNLAKLVRFQRTNQSRFAPIYELRYLFFTKDAVNATGETFPKTINNLRSVFYPHALLSRFLTPSGCRTDSVPHTVSRMTQGNRDMNGVNRHFRLVDYFFLRVPSHQSLVPSPPLSGGYFLKSRQTTEKWANKFSFS